MNTSSWKALAAGLALFSAVLYPSSAKALGAGVGVAAPAVGGGAAFGGGGGATGGGGGAFGGGASFGNAPGVTVSHPGPVNPFPFFGGGAVYGYGWPYFSNPEPPIVVPPPIVPQQIMGPLQVQQSTPFGRPLATGSRQTIIHGVPTTTTGPMIMEYSWPSTVQGVAVKHAPKTFMRTKKHIKVHKTHKK